MKDAGKQGVMVLKTGLFPDEAGALP